jgi:hypothetical protein
MSSLFSRTVLLIALLASSILASEEVRIVNTLEGIDANFSVTPNGSGGEQIGLTVPAIALSDIALDGKNYKLVDLPAAEHLLPAQLSEEGKPDLPSLTTMIIIPDQAGVSLDITYSSFETIENIDLAPTQPSESDAAPDAFIPFTKDNVTYSTDAFYPGQLAEAEEPVIMRDIRAVQISLNPVQYNPVRRELRIYQDLAVNVSYSGDVINPKVVRHSFISEGFYPLYKSMFANFDEIFSTAEVKRGGYMIIVKPVIADTLKALAEWKHQKGYNSRIVPTTEINSNGSPTGAQIFSYIQNAYRTWETPPEYVMLVGDRDGTYAVVDYPYSSYASDNKYGCVDGTDWIPDIFVARLSVDNIQDVRKAISKIFKYEKTPFMSDPEHWIRGLAVGYTMFATARYTTLWVREVALRHGWARVDTVYASAPDSHVQQYFATGPGMIWYRGEGSNDGWWGPSMYINDLNALPSNQKLGVCTPLTCGLGDFAYDCFGEVWIRMGANPDSLKGGPAFYGVSDHFTHTKWNNPIMVGYFDGVFEKNIYHFAAAAVAGKLQDYRTFPRNLSQVQQYFHTYNMLGDPELELRTAIPILITVTHPESLTFGLNHFEANVIDTAGNYIRDAIVTLIKKVDSTEEVFSVGRTDEFGDVTLSFTALTPGDMTLTVSGQNLYPYQSTVSIVSSDIAVGFDSLAIDDDMAGFSYGDGDNLADPDETLELYLRLHNFGDSLTANAITSNLTLLDDGPAVILDANRTYGNLAPGQSIIDDRPFIVHIKPEAQDGDLIRLKQTITDQNNDSWFSIIEFPIQAPNFVVNRVTVEDENSRLDPGDTVNIVISLINNGHVPASAVTGRVTTQDDYTTILDGGTVFGDMPVGDTALSIDSVAFAVEYSAFAGRTVNFSLETTTSLGAVASVPFTVKVDSALVATDPTGPDDYGYYMYDKTDTGYVLHPSYNWVECAPGLGGQGTRLAFGSNTDDKSVAVTLPFDFVYYGQHYGTLIVSTNGFVAPDTFRFDMGGNFWANFFNWPIPDPGNARAQISPFWDDLQVNITGNKGVYTWNDTTDHRFVVAWDSTTNRNTNAVESFEIIIYDPVYHPTLTGDAAILYQYRTISNNDTEENYGTVGFENWEESIGLQYTHDNYYTPGSANLAANMAILITTSTGRGGMRGTVDLSGTDNNSGATIRSSSGQHRISAVDGSYWIRNMAPGGISLTAEALGYFPQTRDDLIVVGDQTVSPIDFVLNVCPMPGSLAASDGLAGTVNLTWNAVTDPNIAGYNVYRSQWENGEYLKLNLNPITETHFSDITLPDTNTYWYYVSAIFTNNQWVAESFASNKDHGNVSSVSVTDGNSIIPAQFFLTQNYPNPFNPTTSISFGLPKDSDVKVEVFNLLGQKVRTLLNGQERAGYKTIIWDGKDEAGKGVASGVYFYKVNAGNFNDTKKMTLLK